jgi:hypothetical protein
MDDTPYRIGLMLPELFELAEIGPAQAVDPVRERSTAAAPTSSQSPIGFF